MLDENTIISNYERYTNAVHNLGFDATSIIELYGINLISAPASLNTTYRGYRGGLIDHLLALGTTAVKINKILDEDVRVNEKSLLKVCFLGQISLANTFKELNSKWHNDRGIMYEFNEDRVPMTTGEASIKSIFESGITLSDEEYQAILNLNKTDQDQQSKFHTTMIGEIYKSALVLTTRTFKEKNKINK